MAKITAPNPDYNGESASVKFVNGVGETDDPNLITWFEEHGYKVGDEEILATEDQTRSELESKSIPKLKEFAKEFDIDLGAATMKGEIVNIILASLGTKEKVENN